MRLGYFVEYGGYKGTIEFDPNKGYYGEAIAPYSGPLKYGYFQRVEDMHEAFKKRIDDYLSGKG